MSRILKDISEYSAQQWPLGRTVIIVLRGMKSESNGARVARQSAKGGMKRFGSFLRSLMLFGSLVCVYMCLLFV